MSTGQILFNAALKLAYDATGLIPGLAQFKSTLEIAVDVAPAVEAAVSYFESSEGERAIAHLRAIFDAVPHGGGYQAPVVHAPPGYHLAWDAFKGYVWAKN